MQNCRDRGHRQCDKAQARPALLPMRRGRIRGASSTCGVADARDDAPDVAGREMGAASSRDIDDPTAEPTSPSARRRTRTDVVELALDEPRGFLFEVSPSHSGEVALQNRVVDRPHGGSNLRVRGREPFVSCARVRGGSRAAPLRDRLLRFGGGHAGRRVCVSPAARRQPAIASHSMTPIEYTSARTSTVWPRHCSGEAYPTLPLSIPRSFGR